MSLKDRASNLGRALLASELSDKDPDEEDPTPQPVPPTPPSPSEPPPTPPSTGDANVLLAQLVAALTANSQASAQAIKDALGDATAMAREQIPENKVSPGHSVYAHPLGDKARPRTALRCPMFLGVYNDEGKVSPAFEYFPETLTEEERLGLNALTPGVRRDIRRHDGQRGVFRVVQQEDGSGQPVRFVVAAPEAWLGKDQFQQMPGMVDMLIQLLTAQGADARAELQVA